MNTQTAKRAAAYARVSTDEQANNYSLSSQLEYIRKYAAEHGYNLPPELEFTEDYTGTVTTRPTLDKLREVIRAGQLDAVIVLELDRLGRGVPSLIIDYEFRAMGVPVEYVMQEFKEDAYGALMKGVSAAVSENERLHIKERIMRGRREKINGGSIIVGKIAKYGYSIQKDGRKCNYVICDNEAQIVMKIYEWFVDGDESGKRLKTSQIARRLTDMRVPTRSDTIGGKFGKRKRGRYGAWSPRQVNKILRDRAYIGEYTYGQTVSISKDGKKRQRARDKSEQVTVAIPAIIPLDMFNAAQGQVDTNRQRGNSRNNTKRLYLMRSRLQCARCGRTLQFQWTSASSKNKMYKRGYYRCPSARSCGSANFEKLCHGTYSQDKINAAIWVAIADVLKNPEQIIASYRQRQEDAALSNSPIWERIGFVRDQMAKATAERGKLLDLYLSGSSMPKELLEARTADLNATIKVCEGELADLEGRIARVDVSEAELDSLMGYCDRITQGIDLFTFEDRRRVMELLDVRGIMRREGQCYAIELSGVISSLPIITGQIKRSAMV